MNDLNFRTIPLRRLDDQISWYDRRAATNQLSYRVASIFEIAIASAIIIVASMTHWQTSPPLPAILGALLALIKGMETTLQWQSNWANYRASAEALLREKFLYCAKAGPYAEMLEPERLLAERTEAIIANENSCWFNHVSRAKDAGESSPATSESIAR